MSILTAAALLALAAPPADEAIVLTKEPRTAAEIDKLQAALPLFPYTPPADRLKRLPRAATKLRAASVSPPAS